MLFGLNFGKRRSVRNSLNERIKRTTIHESISQTVQSAFVSFAQDFKMSVFDEESTSIHHVIGYRPIDGRGPGLDFRVSVDTFAFLILVTKPGITAIEDGYTGADGRSHRISIQQATERLRLGRDTISPRLHRLYVNGSDCDTNVALVEQLVRQYWAAIRDRVDELFPEEDAPDIVMDEFATFADDNEMAPALTVRTDKGYIVAYRPRSGAGPGLDVEINLVRFGTYSILCRPGISGVELGFTDSDDRTMRMPLSAAVDKLELTEINVAADIEEFVGKRGQVREMLCGLVRETNYHWPSLCERIDEVFPTDDVPNSVQAAFLAFTEANGMQATAIKNPNFDHVIGYRPRNGVGPGLDVKVQLVPFELVALVSIPGMASVGHGHQRGFGRKKLVDIKIALQELGLPDTPLVPIDETKCSEAALFMANLVESQWSIIRERADELFTGSR